MQHTQALPRLFPQSSSFLKFINFQKIKISKKKKKEEIREERFIFPNKRELRNDVDRSHACTRVRTRPTRNALTSEQLP